MINSYNDIRFSILLFMSGHINIKDNRIAPRIPQQLSLLSERLTFK